MPVDFLSETQRAAYSGTPESRRPRPYFHLDAHGELRELRDPAGLEEEWLLPDQRPCRIPVPTSASAAKMGSPHETEKIVR